MKIKIWILLMLVNLTSCSFPGSWQSSTNTGLPPANLPDLGLAPELTSMTWINTDTPLRLSDLRGKVVLIEMWTYG
jgi:hypothetical protein